MTMFDDARHNDDPNIRFFVAVGRSRFTRRQVMVWTPYSIYIEDDPVWRDLMRQATLEKAALMADGEPCDIERWAIIGSTDQLDGMKQFIRGIPAPDWHTATF